MLYFDQSATTRPSAAALAAMRVALEEDFANPSSVHAAGVKARTRVEDARRQVLSALFLGRRATGRIIFTGSGTEANNLALWGTVHAKSRPEKNGCRGTVLLSDGEHASVNSSAAALEDEGFRVVRIPTAGGVLDFEALDKALTPDVILVSCMLVNNETGARYDVKRLAETVHRAVPSALVHTDGVQGFMKVPVTPSSLGVDLMTVSGHKIGGPKGVGALWVSDAMITRKQLVPHIRGGGQEDGFRSGTLNTPGIVGFGAAAAESAAELDGRIAATVALRDRLEAGIAAIPELRINRPASERAPGILSVTFPKIKSETVLNYLSGRGAAVSAGSACSNHGHGVSRPLVAFGLSEAEADTTVRLSFNHTNTAAEADELLALLAEAAGTLQRIR